MLNIEILCVGKMSQKWFSDGFEEYRKRLSAFDRVTVTEISEYRITDDTNTFRKWLPKAISALSWRLPRPKTNRSTAFSARE